MIIEMARLRMMGPRALLAPTIRALQDRGIVHLVDADCGRGLRRHEVDAITRRRRHHLTRALGDVERAIESFRHFGVAIADREGAAPAEGAAARIAAHVAAELDRLGRRERALTDEHDQLRMYEPLFDPLDALLRADAARRISIFLLMLRSPAALDALRGALARQLEGAVELIAHTLPSNESIVLLAVPATRAAEIEQQLAKASIDRAPLPATLGTMTLADALPRLRPRLAEVAQELAEVRADAAALARQHGDDLARARRAFHDALLALEAEDHAAATWRAFVLEGWVPARDKEPLITALVASVGPELAIEEVARDEAHAEDAPVVLANPKIFAPFETLIAMLPLPKYGTVDPTPFIAVFFPMLFGVIVGDVGYGLLIALFGAALWAGGAKLRPIAKIAGAVAVYAMVFGVLYGELFGDAGARWFGMHPLWFDRQEAVLGFLGLAIALGFVHLLLGITVAAVSKWRGHRREAVGRGLTVVVLVLIAVALLALFEMVPGVLLMPAVIAALVALPVIVILEGVTALFDFMSLFGHILSYARVMALGTASVMLAVVANKMHGAFSSAAIGIAFALVFHLVNFAITLFSPTIHVMRLHYVEFFGTFFEPGGGEYRPLRHWRPV